MQYPTFEICEFTEEDFISAIERELQKYFFSENLIISRISQSDEKSLGYDGVIDHIVPIYIQFKRSNFYRESFKGKISKDRLKVFKKNKDFFYAFNLHLDKHTKKYEQHNILFNLSKNNFHACYVAPLFFKNNQLKKLKQSKAHKPIFYPWYIRNLELAENGEIFQYRARLFSESIAIIPHREILDSITHTYTFNKNLEICFHSEPEMIEMKYKNFEDFFIHILNNIFNKKILEQNVEQVISKLSNVLNLYSDSPLLDEYTFHYENNEFLDKENNEIIFDSLSHYSKLRVIEDYLDKEFGISQLILHIRKS